MKWRFITLLLLICSSIDAQEQIGRDRITVKNSLGKAVSIKDTLNRQLLVTDSTMILTLKNVAGNTVLTTVCSFSKKGIWYEEKTTAPCATCLTPWLEKVLAEKSYGWKKINEHQYITGFEHKMFLELPPEGEISSFKIFRVEWTKEMYEILKGSNVN
jgi:hypothetical protein